MQFSLAVLSAIALAYAATVPVAPWSTLTPSATFSGATTDHTHSFGIQIQTVASSPKTTASKRDVVYQIGDGQIQKHTEETLATPPPKTTASVVNEIGDGQVQHQTASVVNQIGDGQIQHQTASVVNQIGDGQIQHQTASVVNQIGDGQIQHQTAYVVNQIDDGQIQHQTASVVNQIGDGQIQHQTASVVNQIDDGQIQHQTASVVNQIGDGQIQHQTTTTTGTVDNQTSDGQVKATGSAKYNEGTKGSPFACSAENALSMTLKDSILTDSKGRIGAIVANRQFQFDGPPPQAGSIYAAGWAVTADGNLAIGDKEIFYQCKSGDFYNLYDENIAPQCEPVRLEVIDFVSC